LIQGTLSFTFARHAGEGQHPLLNAARMEAVQCPQANWILAFASMTRT
jgi:hypothetical protein